MSLHPWLHTWWLLPVNPISRWYPDTAVTNHMTTDLNNLNLQADEYIRSEKIRVGNGQGLKIAHYGASYLLAKHHICLPNMLHVPQLTTNFFSIHKLAHDNNAIVEFHFDLFYIEDKITETILLQGRSKDGLYPVIPSTKSTSSPAAYIGEITSTNQWHKRLGHPSSRIVNNIASYFQLQLSSKRMAASVCNACQLGKSHCLPFLLSPSVSTFPLELIFCDVWGPPPALSLNKNHYYISFVDDYSKFIWIFPIHRKSNVLTVFQKFHKHFERMFSRKLTSIQIDGGGEFHSLIPNFSTNGILHSLACLYTHQQQGRVERRHHYIVETRLTLLATSSVPHSYWDEAFVTATFLINILPTKILDNISPFEKMFLRFPDYNILRVFGCAY
jgi:hypothetical protein